MVSGLRGGRGCLNRQGGGCHPRLEDPRRGSWFAVHGLPEVTEWSCPGSFVKSRWPLSVQGRCIYSLGIMVIIIEVRDLGQLL